MIYQISLFEAILEMLYLKPLFLVGLGVVLAGLLLYLSSGRDKKLPKIRILIWSALLYYYLCIVLKNIVGIPTLNELFRMSRLGESLFNPNISLIPLSGGMGLDFILNIFCFIPLGFLCPMISKSYGRIKNAVLLGFGVSFVIEISQLFTLYRATDINDLITNILGTVLGCLCFKLISKIGIGKADRRQRRSSEPDNKGMLPILIIASAFVVTFFS